MSKVEPKPVTVTIRMTASDQNGDRLLSALTALARQTRLEPGNLRFEILRSQASSDIFLILEEFKDPESLLVHRESAHFREFKSNTASLLEMRERYVSVSDLE